MSRLAIAGCIAVAALFIVLVSTLSPIAILAAIALVAGARPFYQAIKQQGQQQAAKDIIAKAKASENLEDLLPPEAVSRVHHS